MKHILKFLPLLGLAPLGHFFGAYLDGAGVLPRGSGFLISAVSMFLLPWAVAALFLTAKIAWPIRVLFFVGALLIQGVLMFTIVPAGATSEMMGIAHRLGREFPPDQMRACAANLCKKERDGTLSVRQGDRGHSFMMSDNAVTVDDSDLPAQFRGKFERVFIQADQDTGVKRVYFSIDERTGIMCDNRRHVRDFFVCSIADGIHAYRYQRL